MYTYKTAVTIQPSKISLNEIKDNWALLQTFWPAPYYVLFQKCWHQKISAEVTDLRYLLSFPRFFHNLLSKVGADPKLYFSFWVFSFGYWELEQ